MPQTSDKVTDILHASCVCIDEKAVLITGASGSGKSTLALELIGRGAVLIADDRTQVTREGAQIIASAPEAIKGGIEARGVGLLRAPVGDPCPVTCVVDMDEVETQRLPDLHHWDILGVALPLLRPSEMTCFPVALSLYLTHGRFD